MQIVQLSSLTRLALPFLIFETSHKPTQNIFICSNKSPKRLDPLYFLVIVVLPSLVAYFLAMTEEDHNIKREVKKKIRNEKLFTEGHL